jgi:dTDP-4-amino-4,6-dideoxygalactose transaminase
VTGPRISVRPSLAPSVYTRRPLKELPWPLNDPGCRLYARARHGLWHGLKSLGLQEGDEVLVPAYHHGSEVEAIVRAGLECVFYETPHDLVPDEGELSDLLKKHARAKALFLIHYLGFPQDSARWKRWCDERDLLLIDDAAQAFCATDSNGPVGSLADLAVFCIYKTYGVIDGAAMICSSPPPEHAGRRRARFLQTVRRNVAWMAQRSAFLSAIRARVSRDKEYDIGTDFGLGDANSSPASFSKLLLSRALAVDAAAGRRESYRYLLRELEDAVPEPWRDLPSGASPFTFPVETSNKAGLLKALWAEGVIALNLWSVPHPLLDESRYPNARRLRERVLGLPVHHELREKELQRVIEVFRRCSAATG